MSRADQFSLRFLGISGCKAIAGLQRTLHNQIVRDQTLRNQTLRNRLTEFHRDESGTYTVFAVYIFTIIVMFVGIGIDLMRYERDRVQLQYTLDRAVLAAADLDQTRPPKMVVKDYMDKAGLGKYLKDTIVESGLSYRIVNATAYARMNTQFMTMTGTRSLGIPAESTAEERIGGVEISMVLDVSGSMNSNNRLTNLKVAARDFVDQMDENTEDGKLTISVVPYATQVSGSDELFSELTLTGENDYSNCVNFVADDFRKTGINPDEEMQRTMHFDVWSNSDGRSYNPKRLVDFPVCEADDRREMIVMQDNAAQIKSFIQSLTARGNTSIDLGMKWGTALLDPSLNAIVPALISKGEVPSGYSDRPTTYSSGDTIKVIVLMTDGQNTSQYYINDGYRSGDSNVWWNDKDNRYSVYNPNNRSYYWPHTGRWENTADGNQTEWQQNRVCTRWNRKKTKCRRWQWRWDEVTRQDAERLPYPELWARTSLKYNFENHYADWMGYNSARNSWFYAVRGAVGSGTKNSRTYSICDAAKDKGIVVFTIGFEAPSSGLTVLENCASSPAHFFDVDGLEISDAFSSIASSIRKLRLTQ